MFYKKNQNGFGIIQVLILVGLMSIVISGIYPLFHNSLKQQQQLTRSIESNNVINLVSRILDREQDCSCQLANLIFNATDASAKVAISTLKAGCSTSAKVLIANKSSSFASQAYYVTQSIELTHLTNTGIPDEYTVEILAKPYQENSGLVKKITPIKVLVKTDATTPLNAKKIIGCGHPSNSIPTGLTPTALSSKCRLTWSPATGPKPIVYNVKYNNVAGQSASGSIFCTTTETSCENNTPLIGTTYYFSIQSVGPYMASGFSSEVSCSSL